MLYFDAKKTTRNEAAPDGVSKWFPALMYLQLKCLSQIAVIWMVGAPGCYAAHGTPLAATQEDRLVYVQLTFLCERSYIYVTVVFFAFVDNSEPDSEADDSSETSESSECSASDDAQNEENQESGHEGMTVEDLLVNLKTKSPKVLITIPGKENCRIAAAQ